MHGRRRRSSHKPRIEGRADPRPGARSHRLTTISRRTHDFPGAGAYIGYQQNLARGCTLSVKLPARRCLAFALAAWVAAGHVPSAGSEPAWTLDQQGRTYTYTLTLSSQLPAAVLLDVLFDPRHVAVFSKSAGRLVVLREDGPVNEVRFDTRRLVFKCSSTYRRTLDCESGSIAIEMTAFKAAWGKLAPHAQSSRARYTVTDRWTHREIVYRQDVETDKPVSGYSLRALRKSMGEFARDLEQYLQRPELVRDADGKTGAVK